MLSLGVISLFPEMFSNLEYGVIGKALKRKLVDINCWNPRDWSSKSSKQVDDRPYGGGPGMVMMYEPLAGAISHAKQIMPAESKVVYLSPQGKKINQGHLVQIASSKQPILFVAGRYEGIDQRVIDIWIDEEWSIGDYVISGGELAAMVFIDAIVRLLPGSLGDNASAIEDSFMAGLLDYPHYTRPSLIENLPVPTVLLQGDFAKIERWRRKQALGNTWAKRPDLFNEIDLQANDTQLLDEFKYETNKKN